GARRLASGFRWSTWQRRSSWRFGGQSPGWGGSGGGVHSAPACAAIAAASLPPGADSTKGIGAAPLSVAPDGISPTHTVSTATIAPTQPTIRNIGVSPLVPPPSPAPARGAQRYP